jgi:ABC-type sugar transport system permease subunit
MANILTPEQVQTSSGSPTTSRDRFHLSLRVGLATAIFIVSLLVRLRAADYLPPDYDEDDYLYGGQLYARYIAVGDIASIVNEHYNYEHPPMTKLIYGAVLYFTQGPDSYRELVQIPDGNKLPNAPGIGDKIKPLRNFSATIGALTAGVVALYNPLAGILIGLNSWHIKYTSQVMLEAIPCLFAALTLLLLLRSKRTGDKLWWISAIFFGLCAASKFPYAAAGFAILIWMLWRDRKSWRKILVWIGLALLVFYLTDPALWLDPIGRLQAALTFHANYAAGSQVESAGFGWTQPVIWLLVAVPWLPQDHPETFPLLMDGLFTVFGLLAVWRMFKTNWQNRLIVLWFALNLLFLLFWPTKWPQYILALTVPISLMASRWLTDTGVNLWRGWRTWRTTPKQSNRSWRAALVWLLPSLLLLTLIVAYPLLLQTALATTTFRIENLRDGAGALITGFGRGLVGIPPDYTLNKPLVYTGTGAFLGIFMWEQFAAVLRFNILWTVVTMALASGFGLWLASLLQRKGVLGRQFWRTLFILPWAIPEFVGALIWTTLFDDYNGGINNLLAIPLEARNSNSWLSASTPLIDFAGFVKPLANQLESWRLSPFAGILEFTAEGISFNKSFWVMVIVGVWVAFPFMLLVSTVALRAVSSEVVDAARVDGAQRWNMWRLIIWPLISPTILSGVLLRGVLLFNAFHIPLMLFNNPDQTGTTTLSLAGWAVIRYNNGYSVAAMINILIMTIVIGFIWIFNRRTHVVEGVQYV